MPETWSFAKGKFSLPGCTGVALQLTVVTGPSTRSSATVSLQDDHAASAVPSETAAHETTSVRAFAGAWDGARGRRPQGLRTYQQSENVEVVTQEGGRRPDIRRASTAGLGRASPSLGSIAGCRVPRGRVGTSGPRTPTKRAIRGSISTAPWPSTWRAWLPGARRDCEQRPEHQPWRRWPKPQSAFATSIVKGSVTHGRHPHHNAQ